MMPCVCGYWPVRKLARLGEQSGVVAKALTNLAPSRASRSMFAVSSSGWPAARISSQRMSSTSTKTMLGERDAVGTCDGFDAEHPDAMSAAASVAAASDRNRVHLMDVRIVKSFFNNAGQFI